MTPSEPIDLADVRSYLAMDDDDQTQDAILSECISFCRDRLEAVLPYYLAERDVSESRTLCSWCLVPEVDMPLRGPVLDIREIRLTLCDSTEAVVPRDAYRLFDGMLTVSVRMALRELGIEARPIGLTVDYRAGAHVPPVVKNALLIMIRNRYERRDEDPLTDAVMSSVYSETRPNI